MMRHAKTWRGYAATAMVSVLTLVLAVLLAVAGRGEAQADDGQLVKVVVVSRHGVRTPLEPLDPVDCPDRKSPGCLDNWAQRPGGWPKLQVWNPLNPKNPLGDLTKVGSELATIMGSYYRSRYKDRLFPDDRCPAPGTVFIRADVDPRTKDTGAALAAVGGLAQNCLSPVPITVLQDPPKVQGKAVDPLFHPVSGQLVCPLNANEAVKNIVARLPPGRFPELDHSNAAAIGEMQGVLRCCKSVICNNSKSCTLSDLPTSVKIEKGDKIKMEGAIGMASTASEIFLLEYANGMELKDVGWGALDNLTDHQLSPEQMARVLALHNLQFDYMQRTGYIARRQGSMLLNAVLTTLGAGPINAKMAGPMPPADAKFVVFVGHDTNVANLAEMLGADWPATLELPDKTAPTGALVFELLENAGTRYVEAYYIAQKLEQMRNKTKISPSTPPYIHALPLRCAEQVGGNRCRLLPPKLNAPSFVGLAKLEGACVK